MVLLVDNVCWCFRELTDTIHGRTFRDKPDSTLQLVLFVEDEEDEDGELTGRRYVWSRWSGDCAKFRYLKADPDNYATVIELMTGQEYEDKYMAFKARRYVR